MHIHTLLSNTDTHPYTISVDVWTRFDEVLWPTTTHGTDGKFGGGELHAGTGGDEVLWPTTTDGTDGKFGGGELHAGTGGDDVRWPTTTDGTDGKTTTQAPAAPQAPTTTTFGGSELQAGTGGDDVGLVGR